MIGALQSEGGGFDIIHGFWARGPGSLAVAAGRVLGVPVVISIGGGELVWLPEIGYGGHGNWVGRAEAFLTLRMAKTVSAGSRYARGPCLHRRRDTLWLPLGVEVATFDAPVERSPGPPWRLLQVASLNFVKNQATLLQAMRLVLKADMDVRLDCIGVDTLGNRLQHTAADLGIASSVRFLDFIPLDAVVPFYRRAHLFVQSSLHEAMGAAVLEAAAAGVPTVGTAVGLVAEMAPEAALAVPARDPEDLAAGILTLLSNEQKRTCLGRAAQHFARTYDADWTAAQFEAVYAKLRKG